MATPENQIPQAPPQPAEPTTDQKMQQLFEFAMQRAKANQPEAFEGAEDNPTLKAILDNQVKQEFRTQLKDHFEEVKSDVANLTEEQYNDIAMSLVNGNLAEGLTKFAKAVRQSDEVNAKAQKDKLKGVHTEMGGGVDGERDKPPKNLDESERRARSRFA